MEMESATMSSVDMRAFARSAVASPLDPLREPLQDERTVPSSSSEPETPCEPKLLERRRGVIGGL
jgi:hypothetical protein